MNDIAALLTAIGGLITAGSGAFVLVFTTIRGSRKERQTAAERAVERLVAVTEDGELTDEERAEVLNELRGGDQ